MLTTLSRQIRGRKAPCPHLPTPSPSLHIVDMTRRWKEQEGMGNAGKGWLKSGCGTPTTFQLPWKTHRVDIP